MKKIWIVTEREFLMAVSQRGYILTLLAIPLLMVTAGLMMKLAVSRIDLSQGSETIGVIDRAGVVDFNLVETTLAKTSVPDSLLRPQKLSLKHYQQSEAALDDLRRSKLAGLYIVAADYLLSGQVEVYTLSNRLRDKPGLSVLQNLLRASLLAKHLPTEWRDDEAVNKTVDRVLAEVEPKRLAVNDQGTAAAIGGSGVLAELVPIGIVALLAMSVFLSASYLLRSTAEEKENRVIEVMLSSVEPEQLLWGKIFGLGGAALLQLAVYLALIGFAALYLLAFANITLAKLALMFVYCLLGYLLYAGFLTATGMMGGNLRESMQLAGKWSFVAISPMLLMSLLMRAPNGMLAQAMSYFPLTAPVTMILRLSMTKVLPIQIGVSLAVLIVGAYLSVRGAAKIFRLASLMYGKRLALPEVLRWLREA